VLTLPDARKPGLLKGSHRIEMIDAGNPGHD
jgi:hypothetical protein